MFGFERCCFEFDNHIGVQLDIVENEVDSKCFCCATKAKPLPQSQPASAKLGYSFEELCFWCFKLKFLSGSTIDFLLYTRNLFYQQLGLPLQGLSNAVHVFDHFHVVKLMNEKLDEICRALYNMEKDINKRRALKGTRYLLLRNGTDIFDGQ